MEAMACGVVPLVPDLGDLPGVVDHGRTGMIYRAGDRSELLAHLESLTADSALLDRLGGRAAAEARHHGWDRIARFALRAAAGRRGALQSTG
jgi:glycosyltransferase involved in cell wall biosynthesis